MPGLSLVAGGLAARSDELEDQHKDLRIRGVDVAGSVCRHRRARLEWINK